MKSSELIRRIAECAEKAKRLIPCHEDHQGWGCRKECKEYYVDADIFIHELLSLADTLEKEEKERACPHGVPRHSNDICNDCIMLTEDGQTKHEQEGTL